MREMLFPEYTAHQVLDAMCEKARSYGLTVLVTDLIPGGNAHARLSGTISTPVTIDVSLLVIDVFTERNGCRATVDAQVTIDGWVKEADASYKNFLESAVVGGAFSQLYT